VELWFYILLPFVAFLYGSVGHGGASGYLALMALFEFSSDLMKPTALILNLFVAAISFYQFYRRGFFQWKLFYPFVITSIPAAFLGGYLNLESDLYRQVLGALLLFAVLRMWGVFKPKANENRDLKLIYGLIVGAFIGFFSGLIGIGGGIILSPIVLLAGWANVKQTAAISALFIWVNSLAGILGLSISGIEFSSQMIWFIGLALFGGLVGGYVGSFKLENTGLTRVLSLVLLMAAVKLLLA
jgi:uncharacterized membrane protein YfcA